MHSTDGHDFRDTTRHANLLCYLESYALVCFLLDRWQITVDVYFPTIRHEDKKQKYNSLLYALIWLVLTTYELSLSYLTIALLV